MKCPECGSDKLSWEAGVRNGSGCVDGRICLNEVSGIFILGCDECSQTVRVISADEFLTETNKRIEELEAIVNDPHGQDW